ncbi:MAG TPA: hypothetical protein VIL36_23275 [Acidimicrobiales bacterium]|jgi:hypothetical protein
MATLQVKEFDSGLHRRLRVAAAERELTLKEVTELVVKLGLERLEALDHKESDDG